MRALWTTLMVFALLTRDSQPFRRIGLNNLRNTVQHAQFRDYAQIPSWLIQSCEALGFSQPTEVQSKAIPEIFTGKDVIIQAHTGSGKTLAFGIPIVSRIDATHAAIQAVVVVPTRELGLQVTAVLKQLSAASPQRIMIMSVVEGSKNRRQMLWAAAEPPHIVVGNPKALQKLVDMGKLRLNAVDVVVLDEVDACLIEPETKQELHKLLSRHLSSTFTTAEEVLNINVRESRVFRDLAKSQQQQMGLGEKYHMKRQTIMCSATIPQRQHFAATCFKNGWTGTTPELINVSADELVPTHVAHTHIPCPAELRLPCLAHILRTALGPPKKESFPPHESKTNKGPGYLNGASEKAPIRAQPAQAIVFLDEKQVAKVDFYRDFMQSVLQEALFTSGDAMSDSPHISTNGVGVLLETMSLDARHATMQRFREGESRVLVCSDMAARGLDLPNTSLVVQMSLPSRVETYIHRAGRTGRLNRPGRVVTFTSPEEDFVVQRFSNEIGVPIVTNRIKSNTGTVATTTTSTGTATDITSLRSSKKNILKLNKK